MGKRKREFHHQHLPPKVPGYRKPPSSPLSRVHIKFDSGDEGDATEHSAATEVRRDPAVARPRPASAPSAANPPPTAPQNFGTNEDDNCETPLLAYQDIAPVLRVLAKALGKTPEELVIYDPYYCAGSMKQKLASIGFPNVINENKDFYQQISNGTTPDYDVLVTNPPYSTTPFDHIERLMGYCAKTMKPYLILQPVYVYTKPYFLSSLTFRDKPASPFYVTPSERYTYETPIGMRSVKAQQLKTSPFVTIWFGEAGIHRKAIVKWWSERGHSEMPKQTLKLSTNRLPNKFKDSRDPSRIRPRKKQRDAKKRRLAREAEQRKK